MLLLLLLPDVVVPGVVADAALLAPADAVCGVGAAELLLLLLLFVKLLVL